MKKALVIAPNWIGDAIMSEPFFQELQLQGHEISVLASPWVAPVFTMFQGVSQIFTADFSHGKLHVKDRYLLAKELQKHAFEIAFILPNSLKSALIPWLANIPVRFGYLGEFRYGLLTKYLKNPPRKHRPPMVNHYFRLLQFLDPTHSSQTLEVPQLCLSIEKKTLSEALIASIFGPSSAFFVVAPGAEYGPAKQWPHYPQLCERLLREYPSSQIAILGSKKDAELGQHILKNINPNQRDRIKNLCGEITLEDAILLVATCQGLASNDSGMMHIGASFRVPQIAFFGSSDPKHTPPLSENAGILYLGLDCSPCHQRKCPLQHLNCLKNITPESAFLELSRRIHQ